MCTPRQLPLQCPAPLPAPSIRNAGDGEQGGFLTISTPSATPALWAVLLLEGTGAGMEQKLALVLLQVPCGPQKPQEEQKPGRARARPSRAGTRRGALRKAGRHSRPKDKMSLEQRSKDDNTKHLRSKHCTNIN